jgi:hypothetical protein
MNMGTRVPSFEVKNSWRVSDCDGSKANWSSKPVITRSHAVSFDVRSRTSVPW